MDTGPVDRVPVPFLYFFLDIYNSSGGDHPQSHFCHHVVFITREDSGVWTDGRRDGHFVLHFCHIYTDGCVITKRGPVGKDPDEVVEETFYCVLSNLVEVPRGVFSPFNSLIYLHSLWEQEDHF